MIQAPSPVCSIRQSRTAKRNSRSRRRGYALLLCLFVALVTSVATLGILNTVRFETLEQSAKQQAAVAAWSAKAGLERTIAVLADSPNFRGALPAFQLPPGGTTSIVSTVQQNGQNITLTSTVTLASQSRTESVTFTVAQLQQRINSMRN